MGLSYIIAHCYQDKKNIYTSRMMQYRRKKTSYGRMVKGVRTKGVGTGGFSHDSSLLPEHYREQANKLRDTYLPLEMAADVPI